MSLSNTKQIGLGQLMYAADHDERFCPAETWEDKVLPYAKNASLLVDPTSEPAGRSAYAMNDAASLAKQVWINDQDRTVLMFASTDPGPSAHGGASLLRVITGDQAIVGFADGSAKKLRGAASRESLIWEITRKDN